ncbi:MAG: amino acid permease [Thermoanaerobaculia bacterium]|nr:amino acid permease [Thermoanaerobaculia bacterium]
MEPAPPPDAPRLRRELDWKDGALITIGATLGTSIFLTPSDIAGALPHAGLIVAAWALGGILTLAGALTYAELGAMFPRAGGPYIFLREAYGPLWGFLFGWASFLVIMCGGIAAIAAGFGEYLGSFVPFFSTQNALFSFPLGPWRWTVNGGQVAGLLAIVLLTVVNFFGVRQGATVQNLFTIAKLGALGALAVFGLLATPRATPDLTAPLPPVDFLPAFGVALIAILWAYDGWYEFTFSGGEVKDPARNLPRGLIVGAIALIVIYGVINLVYLRAMSVEEIAKTPRIAEGAARVFFGPGVARFVTAAIAVSIFGALSANILCCARIYQPMAEDGLFFSRLARIHPRYRTPTASLTAQGIWSSVLVVSGTYAQLFTYVVFVGLLFFAATGVGLYVLRRKRPEAPRPYRTWGYPVVPALFILASLGIAVNTVFERPMESFVGLGILVLGLPAYAFWRRRSRRTTAV